jgi:hypothetical protein
MLHVTATPPYSGQNPMRIILRSQCPETTSQCVKGQDLGNTATILAAVDGLPTNTLKQRFNLLG